MNHYGIRALDHWRLHLPVQLAAIPDREAFFTLLGETAETRIGQEAEALTTATPEADGYLEESARLATARTMAEMTVIRDLILVDPEDLTAIAQLLA